MRYPDRFVDKREREDGMRHWNWLMTLIAEEAEDGRFADQRRADPGSAASDCRKGEKKRHENKRSSSSRNG